MRDATAMLDHLSDCVAAPALGCLKALKRPEKAHGSI
jgi:hypothetical protein